MTPIAPPPTTALNDALALVRLALNPKEASDYLESLTAQATKHEEARIANTGKEQALYAKETEIASREDAITKRESASAKREDELKALINEVNAKQSSFDAKFAELETKRGSLEASATSFAAIHDEAQQALAAAHATLDEREKAVAMRESEHAAKVARLKELAT